MKDRKSLRTLLSMENTISIENEPKNDISLWKSINQVIVRRILRTTKNLHGEIPYSEYSERKNFRTAGILTAKNPSAD